MQVSKSIRILFLAIVIVAQQSLDDILKQKQMRKTFLMMQKMMAEQELQKLSQENEILKMEISKCLEKANEENMRINNTQMERMQTEIEIGNKAVEKQKWEDLNAICQSTLAKGNIYENEYMKRLRSDREIDDKIMKVEQAKMMLTEKKNESNLQKKSLEEEKETENENLSVVEMEKETCKMTKKKAQDAVDNNKIRINEFDSQIQAHNAENQRLRTERKENEEERKRLQQENEELKKRLKVKPEEENKEEKKEPEVAPTAPTQHIGTLQIKKALLSKVLHVIKATIRWKKNLMRNVIHSLRRHPMRSLPFNYQPNLKKSGTGECVTVCQCNDKLLQGF